MRNFMPNDTCTDCNVTISEFAGFIESPNYPNPYPDGIRCTWTIQASLGNRINASFWTFNLEPPTESDQQCSADYVEVRNNNIGM